MWSRSLCRSRVRKSQTSRQWGSRPTPGTPRKPLPCVSAGISLIRRSSGATADNSQRTSASGRQTDHKTWPVQPGHVLCTRLAAVKCRLATDAPARPRSASGQRPWLPDLIDQEGGNDDESATAVEALVQRATVRPAVMAKLSTGSGRGLSGRRRVSLRLMVPRRIPAGVAVPSSLSLPSSSSKMRSAGSSGSPVCRAVPWLRTSGGWTTR
jgi:hypothetical protein